VSTFDKEFNRRGGGNRIPHRLKFPQKKRPPQNEKRGSKRCGETVAREEKKVTHQKEPRKGSPCAARSSKPDAVYEGTTAGKENQDPSTTTKTAFQGRRESLQPKDRSRKGTSHGTDMHRQKKGSKLNGEVILTARRPKKEWVQRLGQGGQVLNGRRQGPRS